MTSKQLAGIVLAIPLVAASYGALAGDGERCAMIEQSIAQGKAVASDSMVFVAVSAKDPKISESKFPTKTAKYKLQSMFYRYCGEFSGYKSFQVETRGGASGSVTCNGKSSYAFFIRKSDIAIKELTGSDTSNSVEIPEIEAKGDLFEEFK